MLVRGCGLRCWPGGHLRSLEIPPQPPNHPRIRRGGITQLRRLENLGYPGEPVVVHDAPERLLAEGALADQLVPIAPRCEGRLRIVQMKDAEAREAEEVVEPRPDAVVIPHQIIARGVEMAGVGADSEAR